MPKLKMWIGNLDGARQGLVIAATKDHARRIVGAGRNDFEGYWRQAPAVDATLEPEILYTRAYAATRHAVAPIPWYRGRCPLTREEIKPR